MTLCLFSILNPTENFAKFTLPRALRSAVRGTYVSKSPSSRDACRISVASSPQPSMSRTSYDRYFNSFVLNFSLDLFISPRYLTVFSPEGRLYQVGKQITHIRLDL